MQAENKQNAIFFQNLRWLVNKTGLRDCDIADALGIHKVSFSRYFSEERIPKRTVLEKIEQYFNTRKEDLLDPKFIERKTETPAAPVPRPVDDLTLEEWRERALRAEKKLRNMQNIVGKLADITKQLTETLND